MSEVIWEPKNKKETQMYEFLIFVNKKYSLSFTDYDELHAWSVNKREDFWKTLIEFSPLKFRGDINPVLENDSFLDYPWFPNLKLNFAENLLNHSDDLIALVGIHESWKKREMTYGQLKQRVGKLQSYLRGIGFKKGDVLACYMPNTIETVVSMLACSSLGGSFTSTSPDFGLDGVIDRFGQSQPKVLVMSLGYEYNEKKFDLSSRITSLKSSIDSLERVLYIDYLGSGYESDDETIENFNLIDDLDGSDLTFEYVAFNHPQYIMYSSGTTGKPKCIVHSAGGTLVQHYKELALHTDLKRGEKILYFTTCGWMMWNWLVSSLSVGAQTYLYEGSPAYPSLQAFTDKLVDEEINVFGTSPKFLKALETYHWNKSSEFKSMRLLLSTGAPLMEEQFDFITSHIKEDIQIASICGGTDIVSCFMLGNPLKEVRKGELQSLGLGMDVSSFDPHGQEVLNSEGELVCRKSFISQPLYFLNDSGDELRKKSYFSRYEGIWHHGDFIFLTDRKTVKVMGRSDATLNPGGVRIGTSEIYQQVEKIDYIQDSVCVGKDNEGEVEVVLYVKLKRKEALSDERIKEIKKAIKAETTPRHIPKNIYQVSDIPYTRSGKKMEILVSRLINGREPDNVAAVSNPQCLSEFRREKSK